ncbi:BglG family transcription antiterminator [Staphylococcus equorum]|uniref:BglG family transcription antiterminator n=4 Tax=Staphylococcus equorum TaxID=246432 RepID=UPI000D1CF2E0|nr:BglG family transcription antiterminator [Staphylococcus equorum]MDK9868816.1 BglG family transcription antiterminator [Staphylococcus equorum]MEB7688804.1 BglG family transcription antiterminator [Staphylococcus equorum]PTE87083.1 transcriptional antiterminator [Staphylococcus equorum]
MYNYSSTYISGEFIGKSLSVSPRTVRNDLKELNESEKEFGFYIFSKKSVGYKLIIKNKEKFNLFLNDQYLKDELLNFNNQDSRVRYIFSQLLVLDNYVKIDDLSERMFVSDTTIKKDLKMIREQLEKHDLNLITSPYHGLKIDGHEFQKRYAIAEFLLDPLSMDELFDSEEINVLKNKIIGIINRFNITIPDVKLENLVVHIYIYIALFRVEHKLIIKDEGNIFNGYTKTSEDVNQFFKQLVEMIECNFNIQLPTKEKQYIWAHILTSGLTSENANIHENKELNMLIEHILRRIKQVFHLDLTDEEELRNNLSLHLSTSITRYKYKMNIRNPLLAEIKKNYPFSFDIALVGSKVIEEVYKIRISESEIGYLALHFELALKKPNNLDNKINTTIVCASGLASSQLIKYKLIENFSNEITTTNSLQLYELSEHKLQGTDLIISTIPLEKDFSVPVIYVNTILTDVDILNLKKFIDNYNVGQKEKLIELFAIKSNVESKDELLSEIESDLKALHYIKSDFFEKVNEREEVATTAYGNLIAVPHPVTPSAKQSFIYIVKLDKPIQWGDKDVQLVFCLGLKSQTTVDMEPIFKRISHIINDFSLVVELLNQSNEKDLKETYFDIY